ncbi:hypothetical protein [Lonsdalea britannica]
MSVNGRKIDRPGTIMPKASKIVPVNDRPISSVNFSTINDFGGMTVSRGIRF